MRYPQVEKWKSIIEHSNANARPGSASMTLPWLVHSCSPLRLWPSKIDPTAGPSKPSCHSQVWHSVDHSPMRRSEEHTSELQSLMRTSYAVFFLKTKTHTAKHHNQ